MATIVLCMMLCHVSILFTVQSTLSFFWLTEHVIGDVALGRKYKQV